MDKKKNGKEKKNESYFEGNHLVILGFYFKIITVIVIIIELRYYMCVHSKMRVDNFVVPQNR